MSFKAKYFTVRVSGIGLAKKVSTKARNGVVYEEDVLEAARAAFAPYGGLRKRPVEKKKKPIKKKVASKTIK